LTAGFAGYAQKVSPYKGFVSDSYLFSYLSLDKPEKVVQKPGFSVLIFTPSIKEHL